MNLTSVCQLGAGLFWEGGNVRNAILGISYTETPLSTSSFHPALLLLSLHFLFSFSISIPGSMGPLCVNLSFQSHQPISIKQPLHATCNLLLLLLPVLSSVCQQPLALLSLLPLLRRTLAGPQYSSLFPGGYPRFLLPSAHSSMAA